MDSTDKRESLPPASVPAFSHHLPFRPHHQHHHCLEVSPHCPQHGNIHHHNHNHLHLSPDCPLHGHLLPHCPIHSSNNPIIPNFPSYSNPNFNSSIPSLETNTSNSISQPLMMQQMNEEEHEDDDEEEIIFVLTDEWKEFFAKSEAKRRLAKKKGKL